MTKMNDTPTARGPIAFAGEYGNRFGPRFLFDGDEKSAEERAAAEAAQKKKADDDAAAAAAAAAATKKKDDDDAAAAAAKKKADDETARKAAEEEAEKSKGSKLSETERKLLHETMERKEKQRLAEKEAADAKAKLAEYEKKEKEAAEKAEKEKAEKEAKDAEKAGDFDRVKKMMADAHAKETEDLKKTVTESKEALDGALKTINDLTVGSSFANSAFITSATVLTPTVARQVYGSYFEVEDGRVVAYDKERGAKNRTQLVNGAGDPLGFEDAIKKLVESSADKEKLLRSSLKPGANSSTVNRTGVVKHETGASGGLSRISTALKGGALKKAAK